MSAVVRIDDAIRVDARAFADELERGGVVSQ
jgi:hypothetical protein